MDHSAHAPGTVEDCPECRALAYEPGWYKAMREERVVQRRPDEVAIPEADEQAVEIVTSEAPSPGVIVPELEETVTPDEPSR